MRRVALVLMAVLAAGCGSSEEAAGPVVTPTPPPPTTTAPAQTATTAPPTETAPAGETAVSVYFLRDGQIAAARRTVPRTQAVARAALDALAAGPTEREREAGLSTSIPRELAIERLAIADGTATIDFAAAGGCPSIAQIVYPLTQFPTVARVTGNCIPERAYGAGLRRRDLEQLTPPIFVESPTVGDRVRSPLRINGTANTYEATFMLNVTDWDGRVVAERFVTATSGSGERGTFDVTIPFAVDRPGGSLIVFERSAEDGSQQHVVEIPLDLQP
jgi:germination protein M